jgi:predicted ester cyclase
MKKISLLIAITVTIVSCNNPGGNMASKKEAGNKAKLQRFYDEVVNAHNVNMIDSFCSDGFINHQPSPGHTGQGIADLKADFTEFFSAFPDIHMKTDMMIADGDTVMAMITMSGTNSAPMMPGMPATNKQVNVQMTDIIVIKDGKATDRWGFGEEAKMMTQLGMMPAPGSAPMDSSHMTGEKKM